MVGVLVCSFVLAEKCHDKKTSLAAEAEKSLMEKYPDSSIKEVEKDEEEFKVFEVELTLKDGKELDVTLAPDGTVMETESEIEASALPFDASTIVPNGGEIKEVESEVTYAVLKPVALSQPKTTYNLEIMVDGQKVELEVSSDGKVLSHKLEDEDDNDENEVVVSIDQVPDAVKATIMTKAQGGDVKKIELESKDGKAIYEAEVMIDGQKLEFKVAPDGAVLSGRTETDDDKNGDDDNGDDDNGGDDNGDD